MQQGIIDPRADNIDDLVAHYRSLRELLTTPQRMPVWEIIERINEAEIPQLFYNDQRVLDLMQILPDPIWEEGIEPADQIQDMMEQPNVPQEILNILEILPDHEELERVDEFILELEGEIEELPEPPFPFAVPPGTPPQ